MNNIKDLEERIRPYLDIIVLINKRYNFSGPRSDEDQVEFKKCWDSIDKLNQLYNELHPVPNCPECNFPRRATTHSICFNRGKCSLAKDALLGG